MITVMSKPKNRSEKTHDWTPIECGFRGVYKTHLGEWWGCARKTNKKNFRFFVYNPPKELRNHRFWPDFVSIGHGWFAVSFSCSPENLQEGIEVIERVLREAFEIKK